jgi:peptide subunit release factor 1 (eRF1)
VQLIKGLQEARGNGTSMISLIMPPKDQVRTPTIVLARSGVRVHEGRASARQLRAGRSAEAQVACVIA